mmetsp:Transcript_17756/g.51670  ORF Transcript_17756/g.51670 Transcript_17756/m.51670 type:complete len:96 (+) Transcript_17756:1180-1467(+)
MYICDQFCGKQEAYFDMRNNSCMGQVVDILTLNATLATGLIGVQFQNMCKRLRQQFSSRNTATLHNSSVPGPDCTAPSREKDRWGWATASSNASF